MAPWTTGTSSGWRSLWFSEERLGVICHPVAMDTSKSQILPLNPLPTSLQTLSSPRSLISRGRYGSSLECEDGVLSAPENPTWWRRLHRGEKPWVLKVKLLLLSLTHSSVTSCLLPTPRATRKIQGFESSSPLFFPQTKVRNHLQGGVSKSSALCCALGSPGD